MAAKKPPPKVTKTQRAIYEAMLKSGESICWGHFFRGSVDLACYPNRVNYSTFEALCRAKLLKCVVVKPGQKAPNGEVNELRVTRFHYVAVPEKT